MNASGAGSPAIDEVVGAPDELRTRVAAAMLDTNPTLTIQLKQADKEITAEVREIRSRRFGRELSVKLVNDTNIITVRIPRDPKAMVIAEVFDFTSPTNTPVGNDG